MKLGTLWVTTKSFHSQLNLTDLKFTSILDLIHADIHMNTKKNSSNFNCKHRLLGKRAREERKCPKQTQPYIRHGAVVCCRQKDVCESQPKPGKCQQREK